MAPTILETVGVPIPEAMTGVNALNPSRLHARALCYDRAANKEARAAGEIDKPKWRMAGLRGTNTHFVLEERGGRAQFFELDADPTGVRDVYAERQATDVGAALFSILGPEAEALFGGEAKQQDLSDDERARLEALGYVEP